MLFGFKDLRDLERLQPVGTVGDFFDFQPDHRETFHDLFQAGVGIKVFLEPGKGEFHLPYSLSLGRRYQAANSSRSLRQLPKRPTSGRTVASP